MSSVWSIPPAFETSWTLPCDSDERSQASKCLCVPRFDWMRGEETPNPDGVA
jgi:hypothetical protein